MEPNARNMFDVVLKRLDDMESRSSERWERWEKRCDDDAAARQTRDAAVDQRLGSLEAFVSAFPECAVVEDRRLGLLEQRAASEHRRVAHLEDFAHAQYTAASVADSWGAHFNDRVSELDSRMKELELIRIYEIRDKRDERMSAVETVVADLEAWRPNVDGFIDDTRLKMLRLTKQWDRAMLETSAPPVLPVHPELVAERSSAEQTIDWPKGHDVASTTRERNYGSVTTIVPTPANGMYSQPYLCSSLPMQLTHHPPQPTTSLPNSPSNSQTLPPPPPPPPPNPPSASHHFCSSQPVQYNPPIDPSLLGQLPKMQFPQFDGDNPKLWLTRARNHFEMYSVHPSVWIRVSTHHFTHAAARWFQSVESSLQHMSWADFSALIHERFSRDQHELLLR
jgi:hypothetical protein